MKKLICRMDDVGASSKQFEVYSKYFIGNFLFLKFFQPFKAWGPYAELNSFEWNNILKTLEEKRAKMTIGITACWVDQNGALIPFPKKFKKEAELIKKGVKEGLLEVANHGLTHCIVGKHLPHLFSSNRKDHREFYDFVDGEEQKEHIKKSQEILEEFFGTKIVTFIPPGGVWSKFTEEIASSLGLKFLCAQSKMFKKRGKTSGVFYIGDEDSFTFHDRDIKLNGTEWLGKKMDIFKNYKVITVREFAQRL